MITLDKIDRLILLSLYRYRYITRPLIEHLGKFSVTSWNRRLARLYKNNFIDRPAKQLWHTYKNEFAIYALDQKGADFLTEQYEIKFPKTVKWKEKNNRYRGQDPFSHPLETARFMVAVEKALSDRGDMLLHQDELTGSNYVEGRGWQTLIRTEFETLSVNLKPDGIFSVYEKGDSNARNYFLEIDRGTMPIRRSNFLRSSIYKKYLSYVDTHERELTRDKFNFSNFRVLFITTTPARKLSMIEAYQDEFKHLPNLCLFTSFAEVQDLGILNAWCNANGVKVQL